MRSINDIFESGELFDGHYKLLDLLSSDGGSADVWLAIDINTLDDESDEDKATKVVIKVYRPKNMIDIEGEYQFRNEFKKVFNCHHENIIQPTYFSIFEEMPYLVLPYCPSGSSELLIGQITRKEDLWKYIYEVASGLAYLHEHSPQIIHQDIKPANVLIDDNSNYAITDFGISAEMGGADAGAEDDSGGTFAYMAPERFIEGTPPMTESDIWAFGATIYEIVSGDAPFGNDGGSVQGKNTQIPQIRQDIPDAVKQLIYSCLSYDPKNRPTARSIVDTVLKKRYARSKKATIAATTIAILAVAAVTAFLTLRHAGSPSEHFDSLAASGDSIVAHEIPDIETTPALANSEELKKAIVLYTKITREAPDNYARKEEITEKLNGINALISEIENYDYVNRLVENAQITEMEDSVIKYSIVRENQKTRINQLIQQLK